LWCVFLIGITSFLLFQPLAYAQSESYLLEAEQHWDTYGVGGTCIGGGHNLAVADVDGDGVKEMITGGSSYNYFPNGSRTPRYAPLKIWNWNGKNITLEKDYNWTGNLNCVYAGDADGDGKTEIITAGRLANNTGSSLRIWSWDGKTLVLRENYEGTTAVSVVTIGADRDGKPEIITIGSSSSGNQSHMQLSIWQFDGKSLTLNRTFVDDGQNVSANSVYAYDLNNDGVTEIVTSGYAYDLKNSSGQLRVWNYDGTGFTLKANEEWRLIEGAYAHTIAGGVQGNTMVHNVKVGDVDSDGVPEIVTVGFTYDGENVNAQLRIWSWDGCRLLLEKSREWMTDYLTVAHCVALIDVDGDSRLEILTSGGVGAEGSFANTATDPNQAQLRVWRWDGTELTLEHAKDWTINDGVYAFNVGAGDVDGDGVTEIVTVGCMTISNLCDPDLRIWSISNAPSFPAVYMVAAVIIASSALATTFLLVKRRHQ